MCTAITYQKDDHYFGRNLDLEYSYNEEVVITPRNYPFQFRCLPASDQHYAMIGMATVMITGMVISTIVTLLFTPVYYSLVDSLTEKILAKFRHDDHDEPDDPEGERKPEAADELLSAGV